MSNKSDVVTKLAPFQKVFVTSDERVVSIIAAKGLGKTFSGARFVCRMVIEEHGGQGRNLSPYEVFHRVQS